MAALTAEQIYANFHDNAAGTPGLAAAQQTAQRLAAKYQDRALTTQQMINRLSAEWTGTAESAASQGLAPFAENALTNHQQLAAGQDIISRQIASFHTTVAEVQPVPPAPQMTDVIAALVSGQIPQPMLTQMASHQVAAQANVDAYTQYVGASQYNTANVPAVTSLDWAGAPVTIAAPAGSAAGGPEAGSMGGTHLAGSSAGVTGTQQRQAAAPTKELSPTGRPGSSMPAPVTMPAATPGLIGTTAPVTRPGGAPPVGIGTPPVEVTTPSGNTVPSSGGGSPAGPVSNTGGSRPNGPGLDGIGVLGAPGLVGGRAVGGGLPGEEGEPSAQDGSRFSSGSRAEGGVDREVVGTRWTSRSTGSGGGRGTAGVDVEPEPGTGALPEPMAEEQMLATEPVFAPPSTASATATPLTGSRAAAREEPRERRRKYVVEDDDPFFGLTERVARPVIGET
jgi:hypothetical protein